MKKRHGNKGCLLIVKTVSITDDFMPVAMSRVKAGQFLI